MDSVHATLVSREPIVPSSLAPGTADREGAVLTASVFVTKDTLGRTAASRPAQQTVMAVANASTDYARVTQGSLVWTAAN